MAKLGAPGAVGAFLGATVLSSLSTEDAAPLMAAILLAIGVYVLLRFSLRTPPAVTGRRPKLSAKFLTPLGLFGGFIDASGGGGWGPVTTSTLLSQGKTAPSTVIGSVSASEFLVAVSASLGFLIGLREEFLDNLPIVLGLAHRRCDRRTVRGVAGEPGQPRAARHGRRRCDRADQLAEAGEVLRHHVAVVDADLRPASWWRGRRSCTWPGSCRRHLPSCPPNWRPRSLRSSEAERPRRGRRRRAAISVALAGLRARNSARLSSARYRHDPDRPGGRRGRRDQRGRRVRNPHHVPHAGGAGLSAGHLDDVQRRRPGRGKRVGNLGLPARTAWPVESAEVAASGFLRRRRAGRVAAAAPAGEGVPAGRAGAADPRAGAGGGRPADSGMGPPARRRRPANRRSMCRLGRW